MRPTLSCLSKLGRTTHFNRVPLWSLFVKGLVDFRKADNFSRFNFVKNWAENWHSDLPKIENMLLYEIKI